MVLIVGTSGNDRLRGTDDRDIIRGGLGDDRLDGERGDDVLSGGAGNDSLKGGKGTDRLTGGAGSDVFVFERGGGSDTVTDFRDGQDRMDFTDFFLPSADFLLERAAQIGSNVVIDIPFHNVTLLNVQLSSLDAGDFIV